MPSTSNFFRVVPSDSLPLPLPTTHIYVGGSGDLSVMAARTGGLAPDVGPFTFRSVPVGWLRFPGYIVQVMATGTTATDLIAFLSYASLP